MRILPWVSAAAVLAVSFFGSLQFLDRYFPEYGGSNFPRVEGGQTLSFRNGQNRGALISGWSDPDPFGVWSDGNEAQLGFVVLGINGETARIFIECSPFLPAEVPEQKIEVWSRNISLGNVTLTLKSPNSFSIPLSGLKLGEGYPLVLQLRMPFARSPQELHMNPDVRKLAIKLASVRFDN